ncbi:MAG: ABC transporter permease, partial [Desulfovibrionales bacterium]
WGLLSGLDIAPPYLLPSPWTVLQTGYEYMFADPGSGPYAGRFTSDAVASLGRVLAGFGLAAAFGIPLGLFSGRSSLFRDFISGFLNAVRAVPGIAWLPLALVWLGIGFKTTVFLVALAGFFPIYLSTASAVRQVDPLLLRAGAMLGFGRIRSTLQILVPAAMGPIMSGLRLGLGIAFAYLVLGELTGVPNGLGAVIMDARLLGRVDMIIVGLLLIAIIGRMSDLILVGILRISLKSARRI